MATARVVRACLSTLALVLLTGRVAAQAPVRKGQWVQLPKTGQLWKLSQQSLAFPRNDNLKYCWMRTITIMKDGRRDYEPEINAKLAYLNSMGGGTVKLGPGVFPHIKQIAMPSYTCLRGSGIDRTYLRLVNNAPRFRYSGSIRSFHTERITITDLTQDGNRGNQGLDKRRNYGRYGLFTELTNFLYLKNVRVKNNWAYGFDPHGSKVHWSYYLIMEDCKAEGNGLDGFTIDQTVFATILRGYSANNDRHGYNIVTGTQMALFRDCVAAKNGAATGVGFGFVTQNNHKKNTNRIAFEKCISTLDHRGGFKIRESHNVWVSDSEVVGNDSSVCYELSYTKNVHLQRNVCNVRPSRKIKLGPKAMFREVGDRSVLFTRRAPAPAAAVPDTKPDPTCARGKAGSGICCLPGCTKCGGMGCGTKANGPGSAFCCATPIKLGVKTCTQTGAPCVL